MEATPLAGLWTEEAAVPAAVDSPGRAQYPLAMDAQQEAILLAQAREGNERSFEQVVLAHTPKVLNLAWRLTGQREEAEDIAQEAFLRLHRSLGSFRGESRVATWLYRTVTRLAIDHLRRERLKRRLFFFRQSEEDPDPFEIVPDPGNSPGDRVLCREAGRRLKRALGKLSARQRAVFTLRHFEELSLKEIAGLLELEEGTVKAHLHRAVSTLRQELKDYREV